MCFAGSPSVHAKMNLTDLAIKEFTHLSTMFSDMAVAVAAIKSLTLVIKNSTAQTMMVRTEHITYSHS